MNLKINLPPPVKPLSPIKIIRTTPNLSPKVKDFKDLVEENVVNAFLDALKENHHLGKHSFYTNGNPDSVPILQIKLYENDSIRKITNDKLI